MSTLLEQVEKSIGGRGLLRRGQTVLIAVSGGVDSMVLLELLHELSEKHSWRMVVAHLNHRLRGRSSDADERLVIRTAKKLNLPIVVERAEVKALAREQKISLEMAARTVRHDFLARMARRLKIRIVALAHHADDQLELFFLRLLRGSGSDGLAGMKWRNPSPADTRIELIRPLLDVSKIELKTFAQEYKISFREDASNASSDIQRNRIRHELLPLLRREYQPALDRTIARVMDIVSAEGEFVGEVAAEWLNQCAESKTKSGSSVQDTRLSKTGFAHLSVAVQRRCIQLQLLRQKVTPDFDLVESLRTRPGHFIKVSPHLAVKLEAGGVLDFQKSKAAAAPDSAVCQVILKRQPGAKIFGQVKFDWRVVARKARQLPEPRPGCEWFDAETIGPQIALRHWRAGDRFQPIGMKSPVKLQDLFVNLKIPRVERQKLVVAETATGEIFWVERLRMAERFKLTGGTNRCLQWVWKRF